MNPNDFVRGDYKTGQFYLNSEKQRFEFSLEVMEREAKRSVCTCCVNRCRSQVKGAKVNKIFLKGSGVKTV